VLFSGTIAENIAMGKPGATRAEVEAAAQMSNAHDFILEFPDGYDTDVGEKGGQLSGGQKQRVAIARAMIKDPAVLLLDEATSALDAESERVVQAALDDLLTKHKRTTIMIAHRLSTIRNADKICVVNDGVIVEEGTHEHLMARKAAYWRLVQASGGETAARVAGAGAGSAANAGSDGNSEDQTSAALKEIAIDVAPEGGKKTKEELKAEKQAKKEEAKRKAKENAEFKKRIWSMHTTNDYIRYAFGVVGSFIMGGSKPLVGVMFIYCMSVFYACPLGFEFGDDFMHKTCDFGSTKNKIYLYSGLLALMAFGEIVGDLIRGWGFGTPGARITTLLQSQVTKCAPCIQIIIRRNFISCATPSTTMLL
jgi:ATP-binding cassette subfamily B (MDR/TAP) protein 1